MWIARADTEELADWLAEGDDERGRMGRISGGLWIVGALVGAVGMILPGASHEGALWVLALSAVVFAYGIASVTGLIPWERASLRQLAIGMVLTVPVVGVALYLTGASISFIEPLLVCSLLYAAFFFPARWAWPLTIELLLVAGTPLLYDDRAVENAYLPRYMALSAGFIAVTAVMLRVKRRLVEAERSQREIAHRDALTGIPNRRAFDAVLGRELRERAPQPGDRPDSEPPPLALLLIDLDDFKSINDVHGHQIGDRVLRATAERVTETLAADQMLARIGGDEFALIAPRCGAEEARRLAAEARTAVRAGVSGAGVPVPRASIGWSVFPEDGRSIEALMRSADERLLGLKQGATRYQGGPRGALVRAEPVA